MKRSILHSRLKWLLFLVSFSFIMPSCHRTTDLSSPDGRTVIRFSLSPDGAPLYSVTRDGKPYILSSELGLKLEGADLSRDFRIENVTRASADTTWETAWGEERFIRDLHNELCVSLTGASGERMVIRFRAFNDGIAFRYELPGDGGELRIMDEMTEYNFASDPVGWSIPWNTPYYEGLWTASPLSEKRDTLCSPMTLEFADGSYGMLHEANLTDYAGQNFYVSRLEEKSLTSRSEAVSLHTYLTPWSNGVRVYGSYGSTVSPWRMVLIADNITDLAASRMMLNLNEPCRIEDTSWIKPMKFIGIWWAIHLDHYTWCYRLLDNEGKVKGLSPNHGATTANMQRYIDFAAEHHIGGVLAEGWNEGWDGNWTSNLASFTTPTPDFDMDYLSRYAAEKGVQIIGHHETGGNITHYESEMEQAFEYYDRHGIHNVKTGYVHSKLEGKEWHKSQYGVRHMRKVIECAAAHHVCIDNHECVMPTGLQRTYPNLMTGEGVRGQEWDAWSTDGGSPAEHLCILPFTRCMAGPVDFTPGTFDFSNPIHPQTRVHSTLARQLALFVTIYSPLQMASDMPESYMQHQAAFRFIEDVPCDWERSVVIDAKIGDYVVTARQDRQDTDSWYIGAITDENERELTLPLTFLDADTEYTATIYADADSTDWKTNPYAVDIHEQKVTANDCLTLRLKPCGGTAIKIKKIRG